jgi:hypothetical protein
VRLRERLNSLVDRRRLVVGVVTAALVLGTGALLSTGAGAADDGQPGFQGQETGQHTDDLKGEQHRDVSPPLRDISPIAPPTGTPRVKRELPIRPAAPGTGAPDSALQATVGAAAAPALGTSFEGVGEGFTGPAGTFVVNSAPPDTNGAVGPNNYVQIVNSAFAVFNKSGTVVYGPAATNTLWSGFGGGCQANNDGDATVVYDRAANRFIISQFSVSTTPFLQCVAVSTTSDPTGSYFRYSFQYANFPDYPKMAVWPDAYYETFNLFNASGTAFLGPEACAYDRAKMLTGAAATQQCFILSTAFGGILPSNVDGAQAPPAGSPNYLMDFGSNALDLWKFHVDWVTPAATTLTAAASIPVAPFAAACSGGGVCIPQSGTSELLDSLADRLMYRLAYRNFGDHDSLVVTHSVTAGTSVGIRWYELRNPGTTPTVFQQGTYAPDASYRWMGSAAQDGAGNIGLGFSISSSTTHPGIHYTAHLTSDPLGVMGQGEGVLIDGGGSQSVNLARWGDYSDMTVDPVDDCTFWYTNEYLAQIGTFNWHTRIGTFRLAGCGAPDFAVAATPASQTVSPGNSATYTVNVTQTGGFTGSATLTASGLPAGASASFNPNPTAGASTLTIQTSASTPAGSSVVTITGASGALTHTATVTLVVQGAQADFSLSATPASRTITQGASTTYAVSVTPSSGFNASVTLSASVPGASVAFSPNPTTGTSTMTVSTTSATPVGSTLFAITGASGALTHSTTVTLVVQAPAPDFSLSASPASRTITQGASTSYAVSVTPSSGFNGTVTLSASGLPGGAAASFSPNPATGTSTLTVSSTSATPAGSSSLTITGTSGAQTHTTTVTLVVTQTPAPDFSLSASPASQTIAPGASTTYAVSVTPISGFNGSVTLSASGLPAGAAASFSPNPVTGTSTLTVSSTSATPAGSSSLTITGTSGSLVHTTSVTLVVQSGLAPDFTLSASPASRTVTRGDNATYVITVTRLNGFSGSVSLSAGGVPSKMTASFGPNPATSTSTLTIVGRRPSRGTYTLTITGTNGSLSRTVKVTLVIQ